MKGYSRLLVLSDGHSGHLAGLTHPDFDYSRKPEPGTTRYKLWSVRREMWRWYERTVKKFQPIDHLIYNGDAIEGKGTRSGSTELWTADRNEQCDNAAAIIKMVGAQNILMSFGTPYHTGYGEDWEKQVADAVGALKIGGEDTADIDGLLINYKHHIGASSVPYGGFTPLAKDRLWNLLWAEHGEYPKAHVIIRSHVHTYHYAGGVDWHGFVTPGLQGYGSKYGTRRVSRKIDVGLIVMDIPNDGKKWLEDRRWQTRILNLRMGKFDVVKL